MRIINCVHNSPYLYSRTWEQNDMSLKCLSKITVFRSRLIKASSFWPTCISIVRFLCSVLSDDAALVRRCMANLCKSIPPESDTFGCSPWPCIFRESPPSYSDSRELQLTSPSVPDVSAASVFGVAKAFAPTNASSEPLLSVLSTLALKPAFKLVCAESSFSQTDTALSRSAGRLCTLASLSSRCRRPAVALLPIDAWTTASVYALGLCYPSTLLLQYLVLNLTFLLMSNFFTSMGLNHLRQHHGGSFVTSDVKLVNYTNM